MNTVDELSSYLAQYGYFAPLVFIDTVDETDLSGEEIDDFAVEQRNQINIYLSNFLSDSKYNQSIFTKDTAYEFAYLSGQEKMFCRRYYFLKNHLDTLKEKQNDERIKLLSQFLEFISKIPPRVGNQYITINHKTFELVFKKDPCEMSYIEAEIQRNEEKYHTIVLKQNDPLEGEIRKELKKVLKSMDPKINIAFSAHTDALFLKWIHQSPLFDDIQKIITDFPSIESSKIPNLLIEITNRIGVSLKISNINVLSAIIGLLYRFIFGEVYTINPCVYPNYQSVDYIIHLSKTKASELNLVKEFCPELDMNLPIYDAIRNDKLYKKVPRILEMMCYCISPLDILSYAAKAIAIIEKAMTIYTNRKYQYFPFEAIFGMFVACTLASELPDFDSIAKNVESFTPSTGLVIALDYARAKIIATRVHLNNMYSKMVI